MLDIADTLTARHIPYAVIGATAAAVHGAVRASLDADAIFVALPLPEAQGFAPRTRRVPACRPCCAWETSTTRLPRCLSVSDQFGNRVDLLMGLKGVDPGLYGRASSVEFSGGSLRVVAAEDFIAMKRFAGGPQDLADARAAIAVSRATIDLELLRALALRFGRDAARTLDDLLAEPS